MTRRGLPPAVVRALLGDDGRRGAAGLAVEVQVGPEQSGHADPLGVPAPEAALDPGRARWQRPRQVYPVPPARGGRGPATEVSGHHRHVSQEPAGVTGEPGRHPGGHVEHGPIMRRVPSGRRSTRRAGVRITGTYGAQPSVEPWKDRARTPSIAEFQGVHVMPIATPEVYAEMLDRAKAGRFAYPAINISSSQTLNAAIRGLRRGRERRDRPGLHRRRRLPVRSDGQEHGDRIGRPWPPTPTRSPRTTASTSPCTPTTARRTSWTASSVRCWRSAPSA